jgi:hypothetical protein
VLDFVFVPAPARRAARDFAQAMPVPPFGGVMEKTAIKRVSIDLTPLDSLRTK